MESVARGRWTKWRKPLRHWEFNRSWRKRQRGGRTGAPGWGSPNSLVPMGRRLIAKLSKQSRLVPNRTTSVLSPLQFRGHMSQFIIGPHMRLQEWVAEEKGYFKDEGLDYEFIGSTGFSQLSVKSATELPKDQIKGAYQTIEQGRTCDISAAYHWTINMAAAAGHGRLWAGAYSVLPC